MRLFVIVPAAAVQVKAAVAVVALKGELSQKCPCKRFIRHSRLYFEASVI
jgi:hypothetical protein